MGRLFGVALLVFTLALGACPTIRAALEPDAGELVLAQDCEGSPTLCAANGCMLACWSLAGNIHVVPALDERLSPVPEAGIISINGERTLSAPTICNFKEHSIIAYALPDGGIRLVDFEAGTSFPGGIFANKRLLSGQSCDGQPAMAASSNRLFVGWKSAHDSRVNLMSSGNGENFWRHVTLTDQRTDRPVRVAATDTAVTLLWREEGTGLIRLATSIDGGRNFTAFGDLNHRRTDQAPAAAFTQDRLIVVWKEPGKDALHVASSKDLGAHWGPDRIVQRASTDSAPTLCVSEPHLMLLWRGAETGHQIHIEELAAP